MNDTWQIQNLKVKKKPGQIQFFSPKKSLFLPLPQQAFLSSSQSLLPHEHQRHQNQSLPEKKGQNIEPYRQESYMKWRRGTEQTRRNEGEDESREFEDLV